ncbi:MAG: TonB-dependent receptor [Bacteroidota bacterium]
MKYFTILKNILFVLLLMPALVYSSGKIKGVVTDTLSNDRLVGANIVIVGTSLGSATDIEGEYSISAIPAGKYIVKCSYIGYRSKQVTVNVVDDGTIELNYSLFYVTIQGEEVLVTAQMQGQIAAINQQITSNTIVNVVSEQKIKELPDANAAEAIGRLPGVSVVRSGGEASQIMLRGLDENMMTITVDGVRLAPTGSSDNVDTRTVDLSTISQGSLSGIELSKAVTADMDGAAIAGSINFVTKTAPEKREIQVDAFGAYGSMDKTYNQYKFLGRYGERFFDDLLGVQVFGNIEKRNRSSEQYNVTYDQTNTYNTGKAISSNGDLERKYPISNFNIQYTPEQRQREGGKILLDFKTPDEGVLKLSGEYDKTERKLSIMNRNYPTLASAVSYEFRGQDINTDVKDIALSGKNHLLHWDVDWSLSYSESATEIPYDYDTYFTEVTGMLHGNNANELLYTNDYTKIVPYAVNGFSSAYINNATSRPTSSFDNEKTTFIDLKKNYLVFNINGEFKFGAKYSSKSHWRNASIEYSSYQNGSNFFDDVQNADGSITPKDFTRYGFTNLIFTGGNLIGLRNFLTTSTRDIYGKYSLNPMFDVNRMRNWYEMNIHGYNSQTGTLEYTDEGTARGSNYDLTEAVTAGYLMNTLNFGDDVTFITGVRLEQDNDNYHAYYTDQFIQRFNNYKDSTATHRESIVLPNFQLILKPTDFMNIRTAVYRGINRPNFNLRLPTYYCEKGITDDSRTNIIQNNSNLKNADAWNYETNIQFYGDKIGLFSISAYYKEINNYVSTLSNFHLTSGNNMDSLGVRLLPGVSLAQVYITLPYNLQQPVKVWGFEIEHQTNFHYLPGFLSHIVLSYNLTISRTQTYTTDVTYQLYYTIDPVFGVPMQNYREVVSQRKTKMSNIPEMFGNVSLGYDIGGFSGRISWFYQAEYIASQSLDNRDNIIQKSFNRVDASLKQEINGYLSVGLNLDNITNSGEGQYFKDDMQGTQREISDYKFGASAELWFRVTI